MDPRLASKVASTVELAPHRIGVNPMAPGYLENVMAGADAVHADLAKEAAIRRRMLPGRRSTS